MPRLHLMIFQDTCPGITIGSQLQVTRGHRARFLPGTSIWPAQMGKTIDSSMQRSRFAAYTDAVFTYADNLIESLVFHSAMGPQLEAGARVLNFV